MLDLPIETTKRIVFHEITKDAITNAIKNPRTVDMNLVQAQQAGKSLTGWLVEAQPVVWQKVPEQQINRPRPETRQCGC